MPSPTHSQTRRLAASASTLLLLACPAQSAPLGGQVVTGNATIAQSGASGQTSTTINQTSSNVTLNWQSFNVGTSEAVNFVQPSASALAVNRILDTQGSQILGRINANGQVWLINPNGVLFGKDAQINVGGLLATTLDVSDSSLGAGTGKLNGTLRLGGTSTASVANLGTINAGQGGYVALIGHSATNSGNISAPGGTVALGAGSLVSVNFEGSKLLGLQVEQNQLNALASNGGLIQADGGQVLLSAGARDSLLASVVNNTGVLQAQTVQEQAGRIVLLAGMAAGTTQVGGTLDASAPKAGSGGFIETSAHTVDVSDSARITTASAQGQQGQQGQWLIDPVAFNIAASGGDITGSALSSALGYTDVSIQTGSNVDTAGGDITVNDTITWSSGKTLTLDAYRNITITSTMDAGAGLGGKLFLKYGQGSANGTIGGTTASYTVNAPVKLQAGSNFATQLGSSTANRRDYTVITRLGSAGDQGDASVTNSLQGLGYRARLTNGNYALGADIDASDTANWNCSGSTCSGFATLGGDNGSFGLVGSFDGLGHTISNLTINRPSAWSVGLFGSTATSARISNVGLVNAAVSGGQYVGSFTGLNWGEISNSYTTGRVVANGFYVAGGLVGYNEGIISDSASASTVTYGSALYSYQSSAGGLVGLNAGTVTGSHATGSVSISSNYSLDILSIVLTGGLVGYNRGGVINNSYATGTVSGTAEIGGLVGNNNGGTINQSYATGSVSGRNNVGGLVGGNASGTVSQSYATGSVSGSYTVGGLAGYNGGTTSQSYATGSVSGTNGVGGLVGVNGNNIIDSKAIGDVTGTDSVGGLAGENWGSITTSFAAGAVSGTASNVGGLVGYLYVEPDYPEWNATVTNSYFNNTKNSASNGAGTGLTTDQMLNSSNFVGFDFATTWKNDQGTSSPSLGSIASDSSTSSSTSSSSTSDSASITTFVIWPNLSAASNSSGTGAASSSDLLRHQAAYRAKSVTDIGNAASQLNGSSPLATMVLAGKVKVQEPGVRLSNSAMTLAVPSGSRNSESQLCLLSASTAVVDSAQCRVSSISPP